MTHETPPAPTSEVLDDYAALCKASRTTPPADRVRPQVQEVLDRGTGWALRGQWLVLEPQSDADLCSHLIVHNPVTDTWGRTYLAASDPLDVTMGDLAKRAWTLGYFSAAAAADDAEEVVRLSAIPVGGVGA